MAAGRGGRRRRRVASRVLGCGGDGEARRGEEEREGIRTEKSFGDGDLCGRG
jgi:hypothetical protein